MSTKNTSHGGARSGAGRPKGSGKYKEPTKAIRVPESSVSYIKEFLEGYPDVVEIGSSVRDSSDNVHRLEIPLYSSSVAAGIPSPAEDHIEDTLDLNDYMVRRPDSTFMLRVEGESMKNAGILPNDILIVDRSLKAEHNKIVIAAVDGELTVKRLYHRGGLVRLLPENPAYPDIELESESDLVIWGVVIGSFRRFQSF
ncbi:LexA family protein [Arenicella xantha]|uniref:SOS response UmuD protein n=1 Tax=Arenicella xantha TaxID=644221 RepID=A0A395JN77_9GAMM|nr:S24 family peptidase [Arenicella xantha]RBP52743.1 SOS response UmuD protein [Arenicella xantha]